MFDSLTYPKLPRSALLSLVSRSCVVAARTLEMLKTTIKPWGVDSMMLDNPVCSRY